MSAAVEVDVRPRSYVYKKRSDSNSTDTEEQPVKHKPPPLDMEKARSRDDNADGNIQSAPKTPNTAEPKTEKKIGHRRVDNTTGQVTYKKRATTDLMKAIQLGIGQTIGSLSSKPNRDVLMQDFSVVETVIFPEDGSNLTPAHRVGDYKFKTYAPVAFRHFRERFDIAMDDFLISLSTQQLIELSNPGASGSVFFITEDDEFIIKTVQHKEADFLQKLLPGYYMNLNQNPRTLLPKFYGLYCYQSAGKNIRLVVMNNLLPSSIRMSEKYDLKGSTYKRKASKRECEKASPTFKDLDFIERHKEGIFLESETYEALMKTIKRDCRVLESFKIMDYSLLLCLYNVDEGKKNKEKSTFMSSPEQGGGVQGTATPGAISRSRSTRQRLQNFSTAMESIHAPNTDPVELDDDDDVPPGGIPARNEKGERLLIYCGIIDILQNYRLKKKLEHGFKSMVADGNTISVTRPKYYAQRFLSFFEKQVFKKVPSLDSPSVSRRNARFRKIVHTINFAMRSPSKKKTQLNRQKSVDGETLDTTLSQPSAGANLYTNRPDLIPDTQTQQRRYQNSQHQTPQKWSDSTITTVNTSHTSTTLQSDRSTNTQLDDSHLLPKNEDFLPPYSETAAENQSKGDSPVTVQSSKPGSEPHTPSETTVEKAMEQLNISEPTEEPQSSSSVSTGQYQTAMTTQPSNANSSEEDYSSADEQDFTMLSDTDISIEVVDTDTTQLHVVTAEILVTNDEPTDNLGSQ